MGKKKREGITNEMITDFEGNDRQACIFCQATVMEALEGYTATDIPSGFYVKAFRCPICGRAWRKISKLEEIEL